MKILAGFAVLTAVSPVTVHAATPRDALVQAVFTAPDKASAASQIAAVQTSAAAALAATPGNGEATLTEAMATGYLAKLNRNRRDAITARDSFEALAAKNPRDPEAQLALGGWHLDAVAALGGLVARAGLGARKALGYEATDRAVTLGGGRAFFPGMAALLRLALDPGDKRGAQLATAATQGTTPTALDRILQRRSAEMVAAIQRGDPNYVQALAKRLLPLGQIKL